MYLYSTNYDFVPLPLPWRVFLAVKRAGEITILILIEWSGRNYYYNTTVVLALLSRYRPISVILNLAYTGDTMFLWNVYLFSLKKLTNFYIFHHKLSLPEDLKTFNKLVRCLGKKIKMMPHKIIAFIDFLLLYNY